MKNMLLLLIHFAPCTLAWAQIYPADSIAQVVSYWKKGDRQSYSVINEEIQIKGQDTTSHEFVTYDVDVLVKKEEKKSYLIEWRYRNLATTSNDLVKSALIRLSENVRTIYKTDENGDYVELVNWKEIKKAIRNTMSRLKKEFVKKAPEVRKIFDNVSSLYESKESIENLSLEDVQQFHHFHGGKYKLGKSIQGTVEMPNAYGGDPFDAKLTVVLDSFDVENTVIYMRSMLAVDPEQLTNAGYNYMALLLKDTGATIPTKEEVGEFSNEKNTTSIIHDSGWIIESTVTSVVTGAEHIYKNIRTIKLK